MCLPEPLRTGPVSASASRSRRRCASRAATARPTARWGIDVRAYAMANEHVKRRLRALCDVRPRPSPGVLKLETKSDRFKTVQGRNAHQACTRSNCRAATLRIKGL